MAIGVGIGVGLAFDLHPADSPNTQSARIQRVMRMLTAGMGSSVSIGAEVTSDPRSVRAKRFVKLLEGQVQIGHGGTVVEARVHPTISVTRVRRLLRVLRAGMPMLQAVGTDAAYDARLALSHRLVDLLYGASPLATGPGVGASRRGES